MAAPVFNSTTSVQSYKRGQFFDFQPLVSGEPTSWSATGLPLGMTINEATGYISGAPRRVGLFGVKISATNADGTGTLEYYIGVSPNGVTLDDSIDLNINLFNGFVSNPGISGEGPVLYAKASDTLVLSIGLMKANVLHDIAMEEMFFCLKEYASERVLAVNDGLWNRIGELDETRFQIHVPFEAAKLKPVLSNYERGTKTTAFLATAQLRYRYAVQSLTDPEIVTNVARTSWNFDVMLSTNLLAS